VAGPAFLPADQAAIANLLSLWVATQNAGDFAGYGALYGLDFEGIRRSANRERIMRLSEWLKDRKRMFKKPVTVGMNDVFLTNLGRDAQVDFTQSWSSCPIFPSRYSGTKMTGKIVATISAGRMSRHQDSMLAKKP
jgi:hypothetical protein